MKSQELISIIVPVYNAESTICKCLDCILKQTYTDFELLLIDDGSTDQSGKICDSYSQNVKTQKEAFSLVYAKRPLSVVGGKTCSYLI